MYVVERRSYMFFFFCSWLGCVYVRLDVWVYVRVLCLGLAPVVRWVGARMPPGVRCAGVVVLGGGAVGAGLGSAGSRCWGGAGARHLAAFIGRFRRRGFVGLGLGFCFAVVSAWRCLRGAFLAVTGPWFCGFPVLGLVGSAVCIFVCMRVKEC